MPLPIAPISHFVEPWATLYSDSKAVAAAVTFLHLGGMLLAGGLAIATDRATLITLGRSGSADADERRRQLDRVHGVHKLVIIGLTVVAISGLLMLASDVKTFLPSPLFWTKLGLVALLLGNGWLMQGAESKLRNGASDAKLWSRLRTTSIASLILWFTTALIGTALTAYA